MCVCTADNNRLLPVVQLFFIFCERIARHGTGISQNAFILHSKNVQVFWRIAIAFGTFETYVCHYIRFSSQCNACVKRLPFQYIQCTIYNRHFKLFFFLKKYDNFMHSFSVGLLVFTNGFICSKKKNHPLPYTSGGGKIAKCNYIWIVHGSHHAPCKIALYGY